MVRGQARSYNIQEAVSADHSEYLPEDSATNPLDASRLKTKTNSSSLTIN